MRIAHIAAASQMLASAPKTSSRSQDTMRNTTFMKLVMIMAWASVGFISYATLARVGFVYAIYYKLAPILLRPEMKTYASFEHVIAFAALGAMFSVAYRRHVVFVCAIVFGSAVLLELLQTLTPDRHGTLMDAIEKIAGGACGIIFAKIVLFIFQRRRGRVIEGPYPRRLDDQGLGE
jgi:VanZ family protein